MDKDEIKGKAKDIGGRIERQVGEWTGDKEAQAEGAGKQVEGKVQNAWGKVKDAGHKAVNDIKDKKNEAEVEADRKRRDEEVA